MSLLSPFFLLGLAALAAPVLVHLVRRTRARRVEFPALLFVRQVPQRTIRRRTLHNLLLLALRCLALLLVVFAFTRPFFTGALAGAAESGGAGHTVILLDASLSMRRADNFAEAKRRAAALAGEMREGERVALVAFDEGSEVVSGFDADRAALRAALDGLAAGYGATDYEQALRGAETLFREAKGAAAAKRVVLVSDFQATGWDAARATYKLPADVRLALIEVGEGADGNAAVTNVEARGEVYGQKYADRLAVHVSNFGEGERGPLTLDFQINDQTVERREVTLAPREQKVVEFTDFNLAEGANRCVVRLRSDDFAPDNEFYFTLRRAAPAKALIVEGGGRGDSFYLQNALAAGGDLPYTFDVRSASAADPASLAAHSLVILNDAGMPPGPLAEAVNGFVEAGGRLVIAAGPHTRAEGFNRAFGRVAPAALTEAVQLRQGEGVAMTEVTASHPIFEVFRDGARPPAARVFGYQRAEPRAGADVLARFEDGSPAFVEWTAGRGRVLLYTSTLGMGWSDLPLTPAYLPLVQQMVRYLGAREASAWHRLGQAFAVAKGDDGSPPAVDTPSGARLKAGGLTPDGEMLLAGREPGFYRLRYASGPEFAAVNVDGREGDFAKLNAEEFLAAFTGGGPAAPAGAGERTSAEETEARQRVWWPLLLAAVLLLTAESLLSRRAKGTRAVASSQ